MGDNGADVVEHQEEQKKISPHAEQPNGSDVFFHDVERSAVPPSEPQPTGSSSSSSNTGDNKNTKNKNKNNVDNETETTVTTTQHNKKRKRNLYGNKKNRYKGNPRNFDDDDHRQNTVKKKHIRAESDKRNPKSEHPHEGSFANPAMRRQFNVTIDGYDNNDDNTDDNNDNHNNGNHNNDTNNDDKDDNVVRHPKKTVALFVGFVGTGYGGMQINKEQRSVQAELELAIYRAGYMSKSNFGFPPKYSWSNSARTDRGVHSCAQVCSCKLSVPTAELGDDDDWDRVRDNLNARLPEDIRVLDVQRVTRKFSAKTFRDKVRYQYLLPSFLLMNSADLRTLCAEAGCGDTLVKSAPMVEGAATQHARQSTFAEPLSREQTDALQPSFRTYRATPDKLQALDDVLHTFRGTHSFHNYTNGKTSSDASAQRYILDFRRSDPVYGAGGTEWIPCSVTGQSFLLHQIRKMVCLGVDVVRGAADTTTMAASFAKGQKMMMSLAPAQGLFLDMSYFESYNNKRTGEDMRITWHEQCADGGDGDSNTSTAGSRWKDFKHQKVLNHIMEEEERENNFMKYIFVHEFSFDRTRYTNPVAEK